MLHMILPYFLLYYGTSQAVKWTVQNAENKTCIILQATKVNVNLSTVNLITGASMPMSFPLNATISVGGTCDDDVNVLKVSFLPNGKVPDYKKGEQPWILRVNFGEYYREKPGYSRYYLANYTVEVTKSDSLNTTFQNFTSIYSQNYNIINVDFSKVFNCSTCFLPLSSDSFLDFKNISVIAHTKLNTTDFSEASGYYVCPGPWPWWVLPLIVLAVLIFAGAGCFAYCYYCLCDCAPEYEPEGYSRLENREDESEVSNGHIITDEGYRTEESTANDPIPHAQRDINGATD
ncbi:hypothetical protein PMAYCL1PPCAC_22174 [Pristionchus mayeri]|uniref:Uncharacterized protein n=1 Tax=Pristionchus mayeri TaxID=1317129 RepID=A0AAN5CWN3_9BILA|nr:hypothetical protein PMAYCL1PPCAC_22174 [Pristionchus mayeri]